MIEKHVSKSGRRSSEEDENDLTGRDVLEVAVRDMVAEALEPGGLDAGEEHLGWPKMVVYNDGVNVQVERVHLGHHPPDVLVSGEGKEVVGLSGKLQRRYMTELQVEARNESCQLLHPLVRLHACEQLGRIHFHPLPLVRSDGHFGPCVQLFYAGGIELLAGRDAGEH